MAVMEGDPNSAAAALFARPSNSEVNYINRSVNMFLQTSQYLPPEILAAIQRQHQGFIDSDRGREVEAIRQKINSFWQPNAVRYLDNIAAIQQANDGMVRWIMAHPDTREYYHAGRIEGYGDRYVDHHPNQVGPLHYDYRRVMDGVVEIKNSELVYSNYYEKLLTDEVMLSVIEKASICATWAVINADLEDASELDHTSEWNALKG